MRESIRRWLHETRGAGFELVRHFLANIFFDNELFSVPDEWQKVAAESEKGGKILAKPPEFIFMDPADFSKLK